MSRVRPPSPAPDFLFSPSLLRQWTFSGRNANVGAGARYPSGKGEVCKTFMRRFDSDPRLQSFLVVSLRLCSFLRFQPALLDDFDGGLGPMHPTLCALRAIPVAIRTSLCSCQSCRVPWLRHSRLINRCRMLRSRRRSRGRASLPAGRSLTGRTGSDRLRLHLRRLRRGAAFLRLWIRLPSPIRIGRMEVRR